MRKIVYFTKRKREENAEKCPKMPFFFDFSHSLPFCVQFPVQTPKIAPNRKFQPSSEKYSTRTKTVCYRCLTQKRSKPQPRAPTLPHPQSRMRTRGPCALAPKSQKMPTFDEKKAVQKAAACMPVLLASSVNALSPPHGLIENQEVTTFLTYRLGTYSLQIGNQKTRLYPTIREL